MHFGGALSHGIRVIEGGKVPSGHADRNGN